MSLRWGLKPIRTIEKVQEVRSDEISVIFGRKAAHSFHLAVAGVVEQERAVGLDAEDAEVEAAVVAAAEHVELDLFVVRV